VVRRERKVTVADFLNSSEGVFKIAFYDNNDPLCYTRSDWKGCEPYMGREISFFELRDEKTDMPQADIHLMARKGR
jgi:hypothetical protein